MEDFGADRQGRYNVRPSASMEEQSRRGRALSYFAPFDDVHMSFSTDAAMTEPGGLASSMASSSNRPHVRFSVLDGGVQAVRGHDPKLFEDGKVETLLCAICKQVPREPRLNGVDLCGHLFCSRCFADAPSGRSCPACDKVMTSSSVVPDSNSARMIAKLKVRCPQAVKGMPCTWTGEFGVEGKNLAAHATSCPFEMGTCPHSGCDKQMLNNQISDHRKECIYRPFQCVDCGELTTFKRRFRHHDECPKAHVPCPEHCGVEPMPRDELKAHLADVCQNHALPCTFHALGCEVELVRSALTAHNLDPGVMAQHLALMAKRCSDLCTERDAMRTELNLLRNRDAHTSQAERRERDRVRRREY